MGLKVKMKMKKLKTTAEAGVEVVAANGPEGEGLTSFSFSPLMESQSKGRDCTTPIGPSRAPSWDRVGERGKRTEDRMG